LNQEQTSFPTQEEGRGRGGEERGRDGFKGNCCCCWDWLLT
jgi:hypothetical protein